MDKKCNCARIVTTLDFDWHLWIIAFDRSNYTPQESAMNLDYLTIDPIRSYEAGFDPTRSTFKGKIKYNTSNGAVEMRLGPDVATRILAIIADELVKESKEIATNLTAEVLSQVSLPAPTADV